MVWKHTPLLFYISYVKKRERRCRTHSPAESLLVGQCAFYLRAIRMSNKKVIHIKLSYLCNILLLILINQPKIFNGFRPIRQKNNFTDSMQISNPVDLCKFIFAPWLRKLIFRLHGNWKRLILKTCKISGY